jgi:aldose sugar dehydrogenase
MQIKSPFTGFRFSRFFSSHPEALVFIISMIVSITSAGVMLLNDPNSLIYYGDAVTHLVIAKRVIDSVTPGIAQFGSIWLPMTHVMLIPFVANNFLFQTGLAGTIVSGVCTAVSAMFLFRITKLHFRSNYYGYLACSLFLMNSSVIYMSIVPMMEAPFMMFFIMASYYALKWYVINKSKNDLWLEYRALLKCGIAITAATLTRYEAWFFPVGLLIMILIILLLERKELWKRKIEAFLSVAATYSFVGIFLWTIYNAVIFKNPLLFLTGPYSAQAQALTRPYRQHLIMQPMNALSTLFGVATDMYGLNIVILSIIGAAAFLYAKRKSLMLSILTLVMLAFPIMLDYVAMVQGSGEIYKHVSTGWFNGRYLVFVAPLFAFSCTALVFLVASIRKKILTGAIIFFILSSYGMFMYFHPLRVGATTALADGTILPFRGDTKNAIDVSNALKNLYHGGRILDFTLSKSSGIIQLYSGIPLKNFIDINSRVYWQESEIEPWTHSDYIVLEKKTESYDQFDPLARVITNWTNNYPSLTSPWQPVGQSLLSSIRLIYENPDFVILKNDKKDLVLEKLSGNLKFPSNIAVIGKDDILVSEKKTGLIHRIVNGKMIPQPVLDVNVATKGERGVLGISAVKNTTSNSVYVFLYYTQAVAKDGDDVNGYRTPVGNMLYRYELVNNKLVNPKLMLSMQTGSPDDNNVGKVTIGPDNNVYLLASNDTNTVGFDAKSKMQDNIIIKPENGRINIMNKPQNNSGSADGASTLIKITQNGKEISTNDQIVRNTSETNGIAKNYPNDTKNRIEIAFDPVTKNPWFVQNESSKEGNFLDFSSSKSISSNNLNQIDATGFGNISTSPKLVWQDNFKPTAISFINSSKLGKQYQNDLFAGDLSNGNLYHFDLSKNRTGLYLNGTLKDGIVDNEQEVKSQVLLTGLGKITDLESGDDGYLYFSTITKTPEQEAKFPSSDGAVYRLKLLGQ